MGRAVLASDLPVLDYGDYPAIDADGIADFYIVKDRATFVMFRWVKVDGTIRRKIVAAVTQPLDTITPSGRAALERRFIEDGETAH